ncbi:MAG: NUDIX domain-containing protein [Anaerolineae bacterium]
MNSQHIIAFLRQIPQSNQDAVPINAIAHKGAADMLYGYALLLQTIGMVQIDEAQYIKATSQTAKYMLESLISYAEHGLCWVGDWKTRGVYRDDSGALQNGATLLHELESRRLRLLAQPTPSRTEQVVQVLIKRTNPQTHSPEFLMQYDANADQYQFIGGRRSPDDETLERAMLREIDEEIANTFCYPRDYQLSVILPDMIVEATLSPTFGALTEYHFTVYHMTYLTQTIQLQQQDAWVPLDQVLSGVVTVAGREIAANDNSLYQQMDRSISGGLEQLADSFSI